MLQDFRPFKRCYKWGAGGSFAYHLTQRFFFGSFNLEDKDLEGFGE